MVALGLHCRHFDLFSTTTSNRETSGIWAATFRFRNGIYRVVTSATTSKSSFPTSYFCTLTLWWFVHYYTILLKLKFVVSFFKFYLAIPGADSGGGAPGLKLEKIWFFGVKSWFFTQIHPKIFAPPSARRNFFKCAPPNLKSWIRPWIHYRPSFYKVLAIWNKINIFITVSSWEHVKRLNDIRSRVYT